MSNKQNKTEKRGQGRPMAVISWPTGKFTRADVFEKMKDKCMPLTVQKHLDWDMFVHAKGKDGKELGFAKVDKTKLRRNSLLVRLPELREPNSGNGLGRKQLVFALRTSVAEHPEWMEAKTEKSAKSAKARKAKTSTVTVPVVNISPDTQKYEETKAALLAPTEAPAAEPVAVAPEAPAPAPAETPAPAPEAVPAETVPAEATAAVS